MTECKISRIGKGYCEMLSSGHDLAVSKSFQVKVFWDPPLGAQRTHGRGEEEL